MTNKAPFIYKHTPPTLIHIAPPWMTSIKRTSSDSGYASSFIPSKSMCLYKVESKHDLSDDYILNPPLNPPSNPFGSLPSNKEDQPKNAEQLEMTLFNRLICISLNDQKLSECVFGAKWNPINERSSVQRATTELINHENEDLIKLKIAHSESTGQITPETSSPNPSVSSISSAKEDQRIGLPVLFVNDQEKNSLELCKTLADAYELKVQQRWMKTRKVDALSQLKKSQWQNEGSVYLLNKSFEEQKRINQSFTRSLEH